MRARITRELVLRRGFNFVAVEADWPDAARINDMCATLRTPRPVEGFYSFPDLDVAQS